MGGLVGALVLSVGGPPISWVLWFEPPTDLCASIEDMILARVKALSLVGWDCTG